MELLSGRSSKKLPPALDVQEELIKLIQYHVERATKQGGAIMNNITPGQFS